MSGIYLHIPFCRQACHYCDFHFSTGFRQKDTLITALHREMSLRRGYLMDKKLETVYFGGGTPSILSGDEISRLLNTVDQIHSLAEATELTLEANPDDLQREKIQQLVKAGINRLSIGIQSFRDVDLKWMNRVHTTQQADYAVKAAQDAGITNLSIDLIYGIPGLSMTDWEINLDKALALNVPHISAYCLTIEPRTVLGYRLKKKFMSPIHDGEAEDQFIYLVERLSKAGFLHYEVSNFCLPGFESRHNTSYWNGRFYLGIGPSAHSFNGHSRQWNIANNSVYIREIESGNIPCEMEELSPITRLNEYLMTGLRTSLGIDFRYIQKEFGINFQNDYAETIQALMNTGDALHTDERLRLTTSGFLKADRIAADFFYLV